MEHIKIHEIPDFSVRLVLTDAGRRPDAVLRQCPDGHTFLCKFWHFQMTVSCLLLPVCRFTANLEIL